EWLHQQAGQKTAPDQRAIMSNYLLHRGSHPQKTSECGIALDALRQKRTSGPQSGPGTRTGTVVSPPQTSERGPLLIVPCLVGIFDHVNRLDIFGNILRRQAVFPAISKDKVLVPAIGFEAIIDVVGVAR
ncbi:hypothetical protein, partial [Mesorhizobium sp. M0244]